MVFIGRDDLSGHDEASHKTRHFLAFATLLETAARVSLRKPPEISADAHPCLMGKLTHQSCNDREGTCRQLVGALSDFTLWRVLGVQGKGTMWKRCDSVPLRQERGEKSS